MLTLKHGSTIKIWVSSNYPNGQFKIQYNEQAKKWTIIRTILWESFFHELAKRKSWYSITMAREKRRKKENIKIVRKNYLFFMRQLFIYEKNMKSSIVSYKQSL